MSATTTTARPVLPRKIRAMKGGTPIVALTAYTTPFARLVDRHCDLVLIGDSLGMVIHGLPSTHAVTMEMMILHGRAVVRGLRRALSVIDMPFGSYQENPEQAFRSASRLLVETGAASVKIEGGAYMAETIAFLVERGIPVMAHVGLTPQTLNTLGGYRVVGRGAEAETLLADARAVTDAGAFALVLEQVPERLATRVSQEIAIPTIGIGSGAGCDGQVLVIDDILGIFEDFQPKFVKRYAELGRAAESAVAAYAEEVRARAFPTSEYSFQDSTADKS